MTTQPLLAASPRDVTTADPIITTSHTYSDSVERIPCHIPGPSKQWELPPRPKPGRKPAIDTPPTKRKQQNREAQRAFRQRRAARVDELAGEKSVMMDEYGRRIEDLRRTFEQEKKVLQENVYQWRQYADALTRKSQCLEEDNINLRAQVQRLSLVSRSFPGSGNVVMNGPSALTTVDTTNSRLKYPTDLPSPPAYAKDDSAEITAMCKNCGDDGRCPCMEQVIQDFSASMPPHSMPQNHLAHAEQPLPEDVDDMEIDFTARFSSKQRSHSANTASADGDQVSPDVAMIAADPCGFCEPGTHCVCASLEAERSVGAVTIRDTNIQFPRLQQTLEPLVGNAVNSGMPKENQLPPLLAKHNSDQSPNRRRRISLHLMEPSARPNGPPSGPGSCPSCQVDPERRKFCQQLAGVMPPPQARDLQSSDIAQDPDIVFPNETGYNEGGHITCTDAYTIISKANSSSSTKRDSKGSHASPVQDNTPRDSLEEKPCSSYEVDCASILSALRQSGANYRPRRL